MEFWILVGVFLLHAGWIAYIEEDAYISFVYAENLLEGRGLVFNPGERVEGITNLLWTLLLAAGSRWSGLEMSVLAQVLGVMCGALTLVVAYRWCSTELVETGLSRAKAGYAALATPALLVLAHGFTLYSVSGLETSLFALLITGGLYTLSKARSLRWYAAGGVLLGAAALTRPDGVLALVFGLLLPALRVRESGGRGVTIYATLGFGMFAGATLWRLLYYGSPVPNTFFAKTGGVPVILEWGLPYLVDTMLANWIQVALLIAVGGALLDRQYLKRNAVVLTFLFAWAIYIVCVGGDYMPAGRFLVPVLPVLYVLAVPGGIVLGRITCAILRLPQRPGLLVAGFPTAALLVLMALSVPDVLHTELAHKTEETEWTAYRREVAEWLNYQDSNALVAANAVGALGYYSDVRVLDMLGLNDAYIARHGSRDPHSFPGHQVGDGDYVLAREPDYVIPFSIKPEYQWGSTDPYFVSDIEISRLPAFKKRYELLQVKLESGQDLSVFKRSTSTQ